MYVVYLLLVEFRGIGSAIEQSFFVRPSGVLFLLFVRVDLLWEVKVMSITCSDYTYMYTQVHIRACRQCPMRKTSVHEWTGKNLPGLSMNTVH